MEPGIVAAATAAGSAVSAGLVEEVSTDAQRAVTEVYRRTRGVLTRKYPSVDLAVVEARPNAKLRQLVLAEELAAAGAGVDPELIAAIGQLWKVIEEHSPRAAALVGVTLTRVEAGELEIRGIEAKGASGIVAEDVKVSGTFAVTDVRVSSELPHPL